MGGAKRYLEEIEARGWADVDKTVCGECLTDYALVDAVRAHGGSDSCDYCGLLPTAPNATAPLELILELVVEGLQAEYEDPIHQVLWSSEDGGYQMRSYDTSDLLFNHEVTEDGDLLNDLVNAIQGDIWVQRDPYAASPTAALRWGWQAFRTYVKRERRFTFLMRDSSVSHGAGEFSMDGIPAAVANAVELAGQVAVLESTSKWWRVRPHPVHEIHSTAAALGSPPASAAKDNRMTPKGIGAFYGASSVDGARAEVAGYAEPSSFATVGQFTLTRDICVVDLSDAPSVPSLFDASNRHRRAEVAFMHDFIDDVATIADPSDRQNLDYIPTQIIAEFLHYELSGPAGPVQGILWRSSKDSSVKNCVIFASNDQMADMGAAGPQSLLVLDPSTVSMISPPL